MPLSFDSIVHKININRFHEIDYQLQYQEVITIRRVKHTTKGGKSCKCGSIPCKAKTISLGHYSVGFQPKLRTIFAQFTLKIQFLFFKKKIQIYVTKLAIMSSHAVTIKLRIKMEKSNKLARWGLTKQKMHKLIFLFLFLVFFFFFKRPITTNYVQLLLLLPIPSPTLKSDIVPMASNEN